MANLQTKICTICNAEKPLDSFNKSKTGKFGYRAFCKECQSLDGKKYYDNFQKVKPITGTIGSLSGENWKDVLGYEGKYQISNLGRLKRVTHYVTNKFSVTKLFNEKLISIKKTKTGYCFVHLSVNDIKRLHYINLLVWDHFSKEVRKEGFQIDHKDNDRNNNKLSNLQQITIRLNSSKDRKPKSGLTGVTFRNGKYKANIRIKGKGYHLGTFATKEHAAIAYQNALKQIV